jgi:tagatose 6-phosphate kinase
MILCIGTTPAAQRVMVFNSLAVDEVNRAAKTLDGIAGKSINVAKVLSTLGAKPIATGFLGGPRGEDIRRTLDEKGIEAEFVSVNSPTRQCITVIDQANATITELVEESRAVLAVDFESLLGVIRRRVKDCHAVVLSGTVVPGGPADFYAQCVKLAKAAGALAIVDAQGAALLGALDAQPALVKPNRQELARTVGRELSTDADLFAAMRQVRESGAQRVVVTAGKAPAYAFDGRTFWKIFPPKLQAVNPIGSGDAFTAGLTLGLSRGDDLGEACRMGAAAGAANALSWMPGEMDLREFERLRVEAAVEKVG